MEIIVKIVNEELKTHGEVPNSFGISQLNKCNHDLAWSQQVDNTR